jgi:hypothetical protein
LHLRAIHYPNNLAVHHREEERVGSSCIYIDPGLRVVGTGLSDLARTAARSGFEKTFAISTGPGCFRSKPFRSEAIYLTEPDIAEKKDVPEGLVIKQFQLFQFEAPEPFLALLRL